MQRAIERRVRRLEETNRRKNKKGIALVSLNSNGDLNTALLRLGIADRNAYDGLFIIAGAPTAAV